MLVLLILGIDSRYCCRLVFLLCVDVICAASEVVIVGVIVSDVASVVGYYYCSWYWLLIVAIGIGYCLLVIGVGLRSSVIVVC